MAADMSAVGTLTAVSSGTPIILPGVKDNLEPHTSPPGLCVHQRTPRDDKKLEEPLVPAVGPTAHAQVAGQAVPNAPQAQGQDSDGVGGFPVATQDAVTVGALSF